MRAPFLLIPFAAGVIAGSGMLSAQTPVPGRPVRVTSSTTLVRTGFVPAELSPEVAAKLAAAGQDPAAAQDPEAAAAAQATSARMQAFKKLVFDRRPSTILKAWAAPELKPYDPNEVDEAPAPAGGAAGERVGGDGPPPSGAGDAAATLRTVSGGPSTAAGGVLPAAPSLPATSAPLTPAQMQALIDRELAGGGEPPASGADGDAAAAPTATPPGPADVDARRLQRELEMFERDVTLGRWARVGEFFATFPKEQQKDAYEHFLKTLPRHPNKPPSRLPPNLQEKNRFSFADALALAGLAPGGFDKAQSELLAPIVRLALDAGAVPEELVRRLADEAARPEGERRVDRREAALLLSALSMDDELGAFLPRAADAEAADDREALNLLARHALAMYGKEQRRQWLETAWQVTQAALAKGEIDAAQKEEALRRAVELAPKVRDDLGPAWLAESFTTRPERGMEIIATIGAQVAKGFQEKAQDTAFRAATLSLQKTAVEALLDVAPELAEQWRPTLGLLASGWIHEAAHSYQHSQTTSVGSYMQRDPFGNIYYTNQRRGGGNQVQAIEPVDLLEAQPGAGWAELLTDALRPHFTTVSAQLYLKVNEYGQAFPYIERLADTNPRKAKELADEFLRVWMRNNNPNTNNRTNQYMFIYGFERRAAGIPLTRSKQERNLKELADYVERLRQLPIGGVDPQLLAQAFVAAHSTAEVYRLETIEAVFGDIGELDPVVLGELIGKMRTNLATVWRTPAVQEEAKTRRSQKEMMQQVAEGYATALTLAQESVQQRGRHWALLTAVATLLHDQNNFAQEQQRSSDFAEVRKNAFAIFAEAADHYASIADSLALDEETDVPFTLWFYAALGASDLGAIDETQVVAKSQLPLIKDAFARLPDGARERHEARFANLLFTRMSAVKPQIKHRYLEAGFEIVGEHEQAAEALKVWQYYKDLLSELRLEAVVDGATDVGTEPFGVRVDIVHTEQIGKESGGFQKYATNQNDQPYAYNYGRPTENYRDKFHDALIAALQENFDILSVTFNSENMEALRGDEPGWQRTPYAYVLLQARGPQVDRIPEIKLDLDFLDTSGFTILPIGSSPVAIDASARPAERPFDAVEVTQVLDERRIDEGKVTLEIKAKAEGLVPDLDRFLDLDAPGFVVDKQDDQGAAVVRFTPDQDAVESERVWLIALKPEEEGASPGSFRFAEPKIDGVTAVYQRYDDADLETVPATIALRRSVVRPVPFWAWIVLALAAVAYAVWFFHEPSATAAAAEHDALRMPERVDAFSVIALLQRVRERAGLTAPQRDQLDADIRRIEHSHFTRAGSDAELDLQQIARDWLAKAS